MSEVNGLPPFMVGMTHLVRFEEAQEVLVRRSFVSDAIEAHSRALWGETMMMENGPRHLGRRRALAPLFSRAAAERRSKVDFDADLRAGLQRAVTHDGPIDLIDILRILLLRLAADVVCPTAS
jgi:cytochrome P450